jgi:hypothetical protein
LLLPLVLRLVGWDRLAAAGRACERPIGQFGVAPEGSEALRQMTAFAQDRAEIPVGQGHSRLQRYGAPIACRRLRQLALQLEDIAEIAMRQGVIGPDGEHTPECRGGLLQLALILEGEAQVVADGGAVANIKLSGEIPR